MSETIKGKLEIQNNNGSGTAVVLDGNAKPQEGNFIFTDPDDQVLKSIGAGDHFITGQIDIRDTKGNIQLSLLPFAGSGDNEGSGWIKVYRGGMLLMADKRRKKPGESDTTIQLNAVNGLIRIEGAAGETLAVPGMLRMVDGRLRLGSEPNGDGNNDGSLRLRNAAGDSVITLNTAGGNLLIDSDASRVTLQVAEKQRVRIDGGEGNIYLGGNDVDGDLMLFSQNETDPSKKENAAIHLDGDGSRITLQVAKEQRVRIDGGEGNIYLGGNDVDGDLMLFSKNETDPNKKENATIHLDGDAGDIILRNADCAEDFDVVDAANAEPGAVMVLDDKGHLHPCQQAYDRKVAGVISGAGEYKPGIVLDRKPGQKERLPLALVGKVYCKVDAGYGPIAVGDLLTTSPTPGYAMKAADPLQAFGAVIGKALRSLGHGRDLIPILIALQ